MAKASSAAPLSHSLPGWHSFYGSSWNQTDSTIILTALGVDLEGNKDVLALRACAEEDKDGWCCLLQDLRTRGATQMDLIVTDGHEGLLAAVSALFTATPRQRCVVHKQRNVLNAIPHRERKEVSTELAGIFNRRKKRMRCSIWQRFKPNIRSAIQKPYAACRRSRAFADLLCLPSGYASLHSETNAIESFFSNVRQRTDQIDAFTTETSCLTIVWAVMQDIHLPRIPIS